MSGLAGYDAWKLATPPEYEQDAPECDCEKDCDCAERAAEDEQDRRTDAATDAARNG